MPRRRSRRLLVTGVVTSDAMANTVINTYVAKGRDPAEVRRWTGNYRTGINVFVGDTTRIEAAKKKLGVWYDIYKTDIYPRITEAYAAGKSAYTRRIAVALGGGVGPVGATGVVPPA